ncbi:FAD-binding type 2 [Penicillium paradoxum]|uniref:FAD-binding type 2 n=1 Tax=Penicillium paradoxum TaxID=176176 RepID=UPI0025474E09|nr:FAD-binding type 2 [Penicillium paradoxum]KAJ5780011.1 FAD-binding type 2 [Penicillium paradoxum]
MSTISNKFWCEGRIYTPKDNDSLFKSVMEYHEANEKVSKAALICHFIEDMTLVILIYADPVEEKPAVLIAFDKLECVSQMVPPKVSTIFDIVNIFANITASESKSYDSFLSYSQTCRLILA